jgi:hypothetical protein
VIALHGYSAACKLADKKYGINFRGQAMELNTVYKKTTKGEEAIRHRTDELPNDLRMVLLLINGIRDVGTLRMVSEHCRDSMAPLIFLEDNGFIEIATAQTNVVALAGGSRAMPNVGYPSQSGPPVSMQYSPPPVYSQAPVAPPPAQVVAPIQQGMNPQLQEKVSGLISYVSRALGEDAKMVYAKIEAIRTEQDFQDMVRKLYTIISQYKGVKDAERFASSFGR